ncbi:hypothetical protein AB0395_35620, partial [Streptosporangium sp. NPDC051023]|uniref:hypothetical protein n=1 Tax=Streptosporangium sp. NPDC051023 TaxID=3155410 RepID=UPI00344BB5B7
DVGDEMRAYAPRFGEASANYALLNRGKRAFGALAVPISRALRRQPSAEPCPLLPPLVDGTSWDHPGAGA